MTDVVEGHHRRPPGSAPGTKPFIGPTEAALLRTRHRLARIPLIRAREKQEKTRPQLAREIGISRHYCFAVETGIRDPSIPIMQRWLGALGPGHTMDLFAKQSA